MDQLKLILKETLVQFWDERQGRERQYIIAAGIALVCLLVYLTGIEPAMTGRVQLTKSLPVLRQQAVEMQQMAKELEALPRPENLFPVSKDSVESSLIRNNLKPQSLSVVEGVIRVQLNAIPMAALQMWLLEMQKSSGVFADEVKITALDDGLVNANITLRQSMSEGG